MNIEKIERTVVERVLSISPDIASAEVIYASPIELPEKVKAEAYTGLVIIGKGKIVPGASAKIANFSSFEGSVHEKTLAAMYFAIVSGETIHVYLENQNILNF